LELLPYIKKGEFLGGMKMGLVKRIGNEITYMRTAMRALKRVNGVYETPDRTFADVIEDLARTKPKNIAILFEDRSITYAELNAAANRYARWVRSLGVQKGGGVALLMENRPEYIIAWLGVIKAGGVAALINTNLTAQVLAHSLDISTADHIILGAEMADNFATTEGLLTRPFTVWATGGVVEGAEDLDAALVIQEDGPLPADFRAGLQLTDGALYIYTSGTTGAPKAARILHGRLLVMMGAFSAGVNAQASDKMYVVLPLYHSAGGVCAVGSVLTVGGTAILRRKFSASEFFDDVHRYKATMFQYIGELCRYMLNSKPHPLEKKHKLRLVVGNGLRPEIWPEFQKRFNIPKVLEFYGATEGNVSLFNYDGTVGAIGRVPSYAKGSFNVEVVKFDVESEQPLRDANGFCIVADSNEAGEALGMIDASSPSSRFEGYAKKEETEKKILRDVFEKGDQWFRTGDLLKRDELGYFYFVDRIGDTFRWKGENVATSEVAEAISVYPGVKEANVYGVAVPGTDGRAGMASVVGGEAFNLASFRAYLSDQLPDYAQPLFIRLQPEMEITGTFKHRKVDLVKEGFDPDTMAEPVYFNDPAAKDFVPLTAELYQKICAGGVRL
jgi:fatty-acyl-CoA synthase